MLDHHFKLTMLTTIACIASSFNPLEAQERSMQTAGQFPGFKVRISLSEKARQVVADRKETIVAIAYFTGYAKPGTPRRFYSFPADIGLGEVEVEVELGVVAEFGPAKLKQDAVRHIDSRGPQLLINVVSGRKSSEDNLLDCDIYEGPLDAVQRTTIPITCKLIAER